MKSLPAFAFIYPSCFAFLIFKNLLQLTCYSIHVTRLKIVGQYVKSSSQWLNFRPFDQNLKYNPDVRVEIRVEKFANNFKMLNLKARTQVANTTTKVLLKSTLITNIFRDISFFLSRPSIRAITRSSLLSK